MCFSTNIIDSLGDIIRPGRLKVANRTADPIHKLKTPTTVTGLRSFLGLYNLFRQFVSNFTRFPAFLSKCFKKTQSEDLRPLGQEELQALAALEKILDHYQYFFARAL